MAESKWGTDSTRFDCLGIDLNRPVDSVKPQRFPYLQNVRSYQYGRIEPRQGLSDLGEVVSGQTPVHSCRRLNDPASATYARVIGVGTHLAIGQSSPFTDRDSGYSGDPLALVPYRPDQATDSWMYVADSARMRKVNTDGLLHTIGLAAPTVVPAVALETPQYQIIDEFDVTTGWGQAGTAGAPSLLSAGPGYRTTSTIAQILFDTGSAGWASVNLVSMVGVGVGERLTFNPGGGTQETQTVEKSQPGSVTTNIAAVIYDVGSIGMCSVVLATPIEQVAIDSILRNLGSGPENVRIVGITEGPTGLTSLRVETTLTWAVGDTVQVLGTLRVYLASDHNIGETVRTNGVRTAVTVGTGYIEKTVALDLSVVATGVPTQPEDYMHISLRVDHPELVTEIKVQLDVDASTNDFTRNYYWRSFRASDLTPAAQNTQSIILTQATIAQRQVLTVPYKEGGQPQVTTTSTDPSVGSQQLGVGDVNWVELRFHIADLIRVGTDDTRSLLNVAKIRVVLIATGSVNLDMDSWWIGGGFGPDTGSVTAIPYLYRYRARLPGTGVKSNWGPATRLAVSPLRQAVQIRPTQYAVPVGTNLTTLEFVLDIQRFGGEISTWHYVGQCANFASPSFVDKYPDDVVLKLPEEGQDSWQPWPIISTPVSGTTGIVAGTTLNDSGTSFNLHWAPGTEIKVNGIAYTINRVISTSRIDTFQNMGAQSAVIWQIDEPTLMAQSLPCLWGDEALGAVFACGDPQNPGRLYFSNGNDPDSTKEHNYLDVTSPSEPLMNGVMYNVRSYLFSSERLFQILPTGNSESPWAAQEIPNGRGLFSRWFLIRNPAPVMIFGARDGIYASTGGQAVALTDADLYPIFPNEGSLGLTTNGVVPPNIVAAAATRLRLEYYDEYLYFDYLDTLGESRTLVHSFDLGAFSAGQAPGGWFPDIYAQDVVFHYGEEGPNVHSLICGGSTTPSANLYQCSGDDDNGTPITCVVLTPSRDQGEARQQKLYQDVMLDLDCMGIDVSVVPNTNNGLVTYAAVTLNNAARSQLAVPLGSAAAIGLNVGLRITFSVDSAARPQLYIWEPRWTFESAPVLAYAWEISPTSFGMHNFKHLGQYRITHVATTNGLLQITVDGIAQTPIVIPHGSGAYTMTVGRFPVYKGKIMKVRMSNTTEFRLDTRDSYIEVKPWGSESPYQQLRVFGDFAVVQG